MLILTTTTADYGLRLPSFSTMPMLPGRCRRDVVSSTSLLMLSSFAIPPGGVPVVEVMICCVRATVQLRADEHLLCRCWVSRLQPMIAR